MQGSGKTSSFLLSCALGFSCVLNSQLACMTTLLFTVLLKFFVVAVPDWLHGCTEILKALDVCGSSVLFFPVPRHGRSWPPSLPSAAIYYKHWATAAASPWVPFCVLYCI
ncbi:uncharacterized protein ISCGN_018889 [Ixodes scapularis]